jgi:MarR family transcriptional regulator for hemolysin
MQRPIFREIWQTPSEQMYHLLTSLYMHMIEAEDGLFAGMGVERNAFWALWHIGRSPQGTSMTDLSRAIWSDKSTITHLIDRLEEAGLARRDINRQDRRVRRLVLTQQGYELRQQLIEAHMQLTQRLLPPEHLALQGVTLEQLIKLEEHMRAILAERKPLRVLSPDATDTSSAADEEAQPQPAGG